MVSLQFLLQTLTLLAKYIWAYRNIQLPMAINVAWWGTMASRDGGFIDALGMGLKTWQICVSKEHDPNTDCRTAVRDTVKIITRNLVDVGIGWEVNTIVHAAFDNTSPYPIKR